MGIQFFGEFLIDRWVITRKQLLEALELQEYRNAKLGQLAIQRGHLTEERAAHINDLQRTQDKRFGDLAVELGWLSPEQLRSLLAQQKNDYLYLGESLLELGHITDDILERELEIFREEQARYAPEAMVAVPAGVACAEVIAACVNMTQKIFMRVVDLVVKVSEGVLGDNLSEGEDFHLTISVPLKAPEPLRYILSVSSDVAVLIASKILKEDATRETEAIVEDAVAELCNFICGNAAAAVAVQGIEVELGPPEPYDPSASPAGLVTVNYPIAATTGALDLRFLAKPIP